jgi:hypothetical protein
MDKIFFPYNIINEHFANDEPINTANNAVNNVANNAVNTGTSAVESGKDTVNAGKDTVNNAVNAGKDTVNNVGTSAVNAGNDAVTLAKDNKIVVYVKTIVGIIILIASISMAIYRIKKHADINKGEYENAGYIFGVILISFCCNMCYLPYAIVYSFVFKKF